MLAVAASIPPSPVHVENAYHLIGFGELKSYTCAILDINPNGVN